MQDKLKYILFGIGGLVVLVILVALTVKIKSLENDKNILIGEKTALVQKVSAISEENKDLKEKIEKLNADVGKLKEDKEKIQKDFLGLTKERDDLLAKVDQLVIEKDNLSKAVASAQSQNTEPVTADAYWGKVLKKKADLELQVDALRDQLKALKAQADQAVLEKNSLTLELNNIRRDGTDLERSADYNQRLADTLTQELAREKSDKLEIEKTLATLKSDNRSLRQQLQNALNQKAKLEQQMSDISQKNSSLENSMANMEVYVKQQMVQVDSLKNRIQESKQPPVAPRQKEQSFEDVSGQSSSVSQTGGAGAIQLSPIVVRPQGGEAAQRFQPGQAAGRSRIVSLDRDNNFAVIDIGKNAGIKIGDTFRVVRAGQTIADLSVIQVRDRIAACDILRETSSIVPGDQVL